MKNCILNLNKYVEATDRVIFMVKNQTVQNRSKHVDIRYIRENFEERAIEIQYVTSEDNAADILTKCLTKGIYSWSIHTSRCIKCIVGRLYNSVCLLLIIFM